MAIKEYAAKLIEQDATLKEIAEQKETLWVNPKFLPFEMTDAVCQLVVSDADIADAEAKRTHKFQRTSSASPTPSRRISP